MTGYAELKGLVQRLMLGPTSGQEPTRIAYDEPRPKGYPLRDQFVFCGRITDHGHADDCPWQAVLAAITPKLAKLRRIRPGLYERIDAAAPDPAPSPDQHWSGKLPG